MVRLMPLFALVACSESGLASFTDTSLPEDTGTPPVEEPPVADGEVEIAEPVADAGIDQDVGRGAVVQLDGTASYDPAGLEPLAYAWTVNHKPTGSESEPSSLTVASPTFDADVVGTWVLDLTVQNSAGVWDSTPARVVVRVEPVPPPLAPVANAGADRNVDTMEIATLDGSLSSDPSGLVPLTFEWTMVSAPSGSTAAIGGSGVNVTLQPDLAGDYVISLGVTNTAGTSDPTPDRVTVRASSPPIAPPISDAGVDQSPYRGDTVTLTGLASYDPAGLDPLTYAWTQVAIPSGSTASLSNASDASPTFVADKVGTYTYDLRVTNRLGVADATPDRVRITAGPPATQPPIANAGADQGVRPLVDVTLDGTASTDPQGLTPLTYAWTMVSQPSGSMATLSSTTASRPRFFADLAGRYEFDLDVRNSAGVWDGTPDRVVVDATPIDGFYVEVSWDSWSDLDLHLLNGTTGIFGAGDCSYCNMTPSWGNAGTGDDPSLDADSIFGYGPETTTITAPSTGSYEIKVHYYGTDGASSCISGCPASNATVRVYLGGVLAQTYTRQLTADNQVWNVARLNWPAGSLVTQDTMTTTTLSSCQ